MKPRSNLSCMARLITLVGPLTGVMLLAITLGVLGFIAATLIPVLGGAGILATESRPATTTLPLNCWLFCAKRYLPPCAAWPLPSWTGGTRGI